MSGKVHNPATFWQPLFNHHHLQYFCSLLALVHQLALPLWSVNAIRFSCYSNNLRSCKIYLVSINTYLGFLLGQSEKSAFVESNLIWFMITKTRTISIHMHNIMSQWFPSDRYTIKANLVYTEYSACSYCGKLQTPVLGGK